MTKSKGENSNDKNKDDGSKSKSIEKPKSTMPEGVKPACFCMDALSGGNLYNPTSDQITKCRRMYKCFGNANADCMLGTESVWTRCEF